MTPLCLTTGSPARWAGELRTSSAIGTGFGLEREIAGERVVVIPVPRPLALSVEGAVTVIVLSEGLLATLDPAQIAAVVRHEAAHLAHHHQRLVSLGAVVSAALGWLAFVTPSTAALGLAVERWADEDATGDSPSARLAVRDALLLLSGSEATIAGVAGFSGVATTAARIAALEQPSTPPGLATHGLLYLPGTAATLAAVPALVSWVNRVQLVFAMAGRCSA